MGKLELGTFKVMLMFSPHTPPPPAKKIYNIYN